MKNPAQILTLCAIALITLTWPARAAGQEGGVGIVEEIRGTAFWRQNAAARTNRLEPMSDTGRRLYPGEQVRCARGCSLTLLLGRRRKLIRPSAWFTIHRASSSQSDPFKKMLDDYGRPGGRDRGGSLQVFTPSDHSVVLIEQFVVRWLPSAAGCTLSLSIRDIRGNRVWRKESADGASGSLDDASAKQALAEYRAKNGLGPVTLAVDNSCGSMAVLSFSLLSARGELSLKEDLAFWDKQPGTFVPHLGRASVYNRYRMFPQAADAYEAALMEALDSQHLLIRAITAHRVAGNLSRAADLIKRLPPGTNIP